MSELQEAAKRLREFIRKHEPGQCRWFSAASFGLKCECPLCDVDTLLSQAKLKETDDDS